jgi:hypothetical protein
MKVFLLRLGWPVFWLVLATLAVGGLLLAAIILFGPPHALERLDADVSQGDSGEVPVSVWLYTPYVAPGDRVSVEVGVYGRGLAIAVNKVNGTFAGGSFQKDGPGPRWGMTLSTSGMGWHRGFVQFDLTVPPNTRPGDVLQLQMELACTVALPAHGSRFRNKEATARASVPVTVRSPADAVRRRAGAAGGALGAFGLACLLVAWFHRALRGGALHGKVADMVGAVLFLPAALAYGWLGYMGFALPLLAAMGLSWAWVGPALVGLWWVGPLLVGILFRPRDRYRPRRPSPPRGLDFSMTGLPES